MGIVLKNNAETTLAANISSTDTTIYVDDVSSFPSLGVDEYFYCTLESTTGNIEIIKVTQTNATSFVATRAQEGTVAIPFNIGARAELRVTVQSLDDYFDGAAASEIATAIADHEAEADPHPGYVTTAEGAALQAAAEATASSALSAHAAAADPHPGYVTTAEGAALQAAAEANAATATATAITAHEGEADPHSVYELESNNTASAILTKLLTVDGPGTGLNADVLDGEQGSYYTDITARLGYTPLNAASNLSDLASASSARENLSDGVDSLFIVVTGQSNAVVDDTYSWTPPSNLRIWNNAGGTFDTVGGTTISLAKAIGAEHARRNPLRMVYVVNYAYLGAPISYWKTGGGVDVYGTLKTWTESGLSEVGRSTIDMLYWWQGEADAASPGSYATDWETVIARFRAETWFPAETPVTIMGMTEFGSQASVGRVMNTILSELAGVETQRTYIHTPDLPNALWPDDIHMSGAGYAAAGRMAVNPPHENAAQKRRTRTFGSILATYNQAAATALTASNTTTHSDATANLNLITDSGTFQIVQYSSAHGIFTDATVMAAPSGMIIDAPTGVSLLHNSVAALATTSTGISVNGTGLFSKNQNGSTALTASNTTTHTDATANLNLTTDAGTFQIVHYSTANGSFPSATFLAAPSIMILNAPSGVSLLHNGAGKLATASGGVTITGTGTASALTAANNQAAATSLTASNTTTNSSATANLNLTTDAGTFQIVHYSTANGTFPSTTVLASPAGMILNGVSGISLLHNSAAKLATVSGGVAITGAASFSDASGTRSNLGLGTAATRNTGTSGTNVPLLSGTNTWSNTQQFATARFGDANFQALLSTDAYIFFDSNDYLRYDRGSNALYTYVASSAITATGAIGFGPGGDNAYACGNGFARWTDIFAVSGSVNTSNALEKDNFTAATAPHFDAIKDIYASTSFYQWKHAIAAKGEANARWHFGPTAQGVQAAFAKHNVDAERLGLYCVDKRTLEDGTEEKNYGLRSNQLHDMAITDLYRRIEELEAKLTKKDK